MDKRNLTFRMKSILAMFGALAVLLAAYSPIYAGQHDYDIANAPGATVRADINDAFQAAATNNSGATEPASTYANMWWFDTSTNILKIRDNSDANWINVASKSGTTWIPYRAGTLIGTAALLTTDTDEALTSNSDSNVPTQQAVKAYADTKIPSSYLDTDNTLAADSDVKVATQKAVKAYVDNNSGNIEIFTSNGTFTVPAGVTKVYITMIGGGGGGGNGSSSAGGGGGGAGGAYVINRPFTVTPSGTETVTIGAGGASNTAGGATSFGSLSVPGGEEGDADTEGQAGGVSPGGFNGSSGSTGGFGYFDSGDGGNGSGTIGGKGGGTPFGAGGNGADSGTGSAAAANTGAGGGGGDQNGGAGGAGGSGIVIVMY